MSVGFHQSHHKHRLSDYVIGMLEIAIKEKVVLEYHTVADTIRKTRITKSAVDIFETAFVMGAKPRIYRDHDGHAFLAPDGTAITMFGIVYGGRDNIAAGEWTLDNIVTHPNYTTWLKELLYAHEEADPNEDDDAAVEYPVTGSGDDGFDSETTGSADEDESEGATDQEVEREGHDSDDQCEEVDDEVDDERGEQRVGSNGPGELERNFNETSSSHTQLLLRLFRAMSSSINSIFTGVNAFLWNESARIANFTVTDSSSVLVPLHHHQTNGDIPDFPSTFGAIRQLGGKSYLLPRDYLGSA